MNWHSRSTAAAHAPGPFRLDGRVALFALYREARGRALGSNHGIIFRSCCLPVPSSIVWLLCRRLSSRAHAHTAQTQTLDRCWTSP